MYNQAKNFIGNEWKSSQTKKTIPVINPSNGETIGELARSNASDIDEAVQAAKKALDGEWSKLSATDRGRLLKKLSKLISDHGDELAQLEMKDVGKPLKQAKNDVIVCARYFEFYGDAADKVMGETIPFQNGFTVLTLREPHGVTGHIVPWNYPMQMTARSLAGALAMGNTCVVKPAEDASLSILYLCKLAVDAGFPPGVINVVTGLGTEAGSALTEHPGIHHMSFTGSNPVGQAVQTAAAKNTIPVTLELGGKSPQIVFADADLEAAIPILVNAAIQNAGQTCSAGTRIIIEETIYNKVSTLLGEKFKALKVSEAHSDQDVGPVISKKQKDRILKMIHHGKESGLKVVAEAELSKDLPKDGFYIAPIIFGEVPTDHPLAQEEVFGPVLSLIKVKDEAEAIAVANGTKYGLVAGVWTRDGSRALRMAKKVQAGQVFINNYGAAGGVELPFGGVKGSGHGREKGMEALYGFSVVKTVTIKHD